jgi:hypothetical protein
VLQFPNGKIKVKILPNAWKEFKWLVLYAKISTSTTFISAAELILARKMLKITKFRTFSPSFREFFYLSTKIIFFLFFLIKLLA